MVQELFEKSLVTQLFKEWLAYSMEPKGSLLCSEKFTIGLYPEPAESSLPHQSLSPKSTPQCPPTYALVFPVVSTLWVSQPKPL
jgi:hypothetical protein